MLLPPHEPHLDPSLVDAGEEIAALKKALSAERTRAKVQEKALRKSDKIIRRLEHTAKISSQIGERNKKLMFRTHEALTREIDKQKETEDRLREAMSRVEAAARAKSEFLANMSHELRTPMNGVMGMVELAMAGPLAPDQAEYLRTARASASDLLVLLNDILDLSKIEAGQLALEAIPFSPWDAVDEVCAVLAPGALENGVPVHLLVDRSVPAEVIGDPVRFRQVLKNLLSNAIKFTRSGRIDIRLQYSGQDLQASVTDTGIGIQPDRLPMIFQPFSQADTSTTRNFGGTGLGLTITRQLAHLMGGTLQATSTPEVGSTFTFTARMLEHAARFHENSVLLGLRVGVEVDAEEREQVYRLLEVLGCTPEPLSHHSPQRVVLTDEKASEATMAALKRQGCAILRIATPNVATGIGQILRRPLRRRLLAEILRDLIQGASTRPVSTPTLPQPAQKECRILVAEDHPVNQLLIRRFIENAGHSCTIVPNGQAAVELIREESFDLIFMDCNMPIMDGYTATQQIRALDLMNQPLIVALTASAMAGDREECLAAGMNAYLSKPVTQNNIAETISGYLSEARTG
ncbi:MAG: signal transduction histidine kinase/CheY-like chemotaxis protein [Myxococcota bacterium]